MMKNERKILKNNQELIDVLFELMIEKFWIAPSDRRRSHAAFKEFERVVRRLVMMLGDTDLPVASAAQLGELLRTAECLRESIARIDETRIFPAGRCEDAVEAVRRIEETIRAKCNCVLAE